MVIPETETLSQGEVEPALHSGQQQKNYLFSSLGRQSSIYSLTLDEFQHALSESGKNFGSMNMDEFLTSIWNAEENQAINSTTNVNSNNAMTNHQTQLTLNDASSHRAIVKQPSLARQSSLALPAPLCRKTVDEVWSEIHQQGQQQNNNSNENNGNNVQSPETTQRQPTFGEMTLEDFLIKAGVVREQHHTPAAQPTQPQQRFGMYPTNNNPVMSSAFGRSLMGMTGISGGGNNSASVGATYQQMPPGRSVVGTESSAYIGSEKRNGGYSVTQLQQQPPPQQQVIYSGRVGNGGGYASGQIGVVPSMSPVSSEAMCNNQQVDSSGSQYGMDQMGGIRKKRIIDGPVEKVVERRQRRMIKNRESAARSRARKQVKHCTSTCIIYRNDTVFVEVTNGHNQLSFAYAGIHC